MNFHKNILFIDGTGKAAGKTLFANQVRANYADKIPTIGVKIYPYFHQLSSNTQIIEESNDYYITKELNSHINKDSQRFLNTRFKKVYYVQGLDDKVPLVFNKLVNLTS